MPQGHSDRRNPAFALGSSPNFGQIESENTSIIEEAKNLLSQFMKHSSHKAQGSQKNDGGDPKDYATSHNISSPLGKRDSDFTVPRHTPCTNSRSIPPGRGPENQRTSVYSKPSRENSRPIPKRAASLPKSDRKRSFSPKQSAGLDSAMVPERPKITRTRRSGRSKSGPTNYFEPVHLFDSEEDSEQCLVQSSEQTLPPGAFSKNVKLSGPTHTVFSSRGFQIVKLRFKKVADLDDLEHACYSPEPNPANYMQRAIKSPEAVLHVDFGEDEMICVLELLSYHGLQWSTSSDISVTDQVIQALSSCAVPQELVRKLSRICRLSHALSAQGVVSDSSSILKFLQSSDKKESVHAKRLITKILGEREQNCGGQYGYQIDEIHGLATRLQCASKLDRRNHRDLDRFLKDAKAGCLPSIPYVVKAIVSQNEHLKSSQSFAHLLQNRELGCNVNRKINSNIASNFKLCKQWKGASNDVVVMAWSPDGTKFAAGATAQCDEHNMQYNRGNNLLLGDLMQNCLEELPDHCIPRPAGRGTNRAINDAGLFMSVTAVQWFHDFLLTGSYDNTVKLWDFVGGKPSCYKTLRHDAKVLVMARSTLEPNALATGTRGIGLWNIRESAYTPLDIQGFQHRKDIELVPSSLAWGTVPSTKNIVLAGLAERDDGIPQNGLLAAWQVIEGGTIPLSYSPNSQNIFDVKWHPTSAAFVTGSSTGLRNIGSVVRHYEPLKSRRRVCEFDCPALDINDVTFCPINSNYVTASCTDGNTYVWDYRKNNHVVLKLPHGGPLNQTDETLTREQADVGVRVALWGNEIDQFYTGASDGILKRWNILKSSEDAFIEDTASLEEEIMCATFSDDKSNLLVGDAAGGIHVLSSGPFFNTTERSFTFQRAPQPICRNYGSGSESGVQAGRNLLLSGQLSLHPVYGAGQGPHYVGPFATWARPEGTPCERIAQTQLREELQIRQLDGIPIERRSGLDEQSRKDVESQIQLARIRNQSQSDSKRKRAEPLNRVTPMPLSDNFIDLCSDDEGQPCSLTASPKKLKRRAKARSNEPIIVNVGCEVIDLTEETDDGEESAGDSPRMELSCGPDCSAFDETLKLENDHVKEELEEALDDDFWWPSSHTVDPNIQDDAV